jgi:hypothetical protein
MLLPLQLMLPLPRKPAKRIQLRPKAVVCCSLLRVLLFLLL